MSKPAPLPVYEYRIDLKPDDAGQPAQRTVRAVQYWQEGSWFVFDDATATVLSIRQELVLAIERGDKVGEQGMEILP